MGIIINMGAWFTAEDKADKPFNLRESYMDAKLIGSWGNDTENELEKEIFMAANWLRYAPAQFEKHINNAVLKFKDSHTKGATKIDELIKKLKTFGPGDLC